MTIIEKAEPCEHKNNFQKDCDENKTQQFQSETKEIVKVLFSSREGSQTIRSNRSNERFERVQAPPQVAKALDSPCSSWGVTLLLLRVPGHLLAPGLAPRRCRVDRANQWPIRRHDLWQIIFIPESKGSFLPAKSVLLKSKPGWEHWPSVSIRKSCD